MKKLIIAIVAVALLSLTGCDDQDARDYANELVGVLKTYQVEVNKKIVAEKKSYKDLAGTYAYARDVDLLTGLTNERLNRADSLTDALIGGEKFTPSDMHKSLLDYATHDFEATRDAFERESDGQAEYLASLESLNLQTENIAQLTKALEALAKPKGSLKKLKELKTAAEEFKTRFDELQCEELGAEIACLKAQIAALTDQQKAQKENLQAQLKELEERAKDCKEDIIKKATCPDQKG
jgi:DNA repair exonuclease SbcCD ATPase subunit